MKTLISSLILIFALSAQANSIEPLLGLEITSSAVKIRVVSGGCTTKKSFEVQKRVDPQNQAVQLLFVRTRPDNCESEPFEAYFPNGVVISFEMNDLGIMRGQNVYVGNPFGH